jgi:hypothetical protein
MCSAGVTSSRESRCEQLKCMLCGQHIGEREDEERKVENDKVVVQRK